MSRRDEFFAANNGVIKERVQPKNLIDDSVGQLEALMESGKQPVKTGHEQEIGTGTVSFQNGFKINIHAKQNKTIRKSFLFSEALNDKFSSMAKESGVSENELINKILEQIFEL